MSSHPTTDLPPVGTVLRSAPGGNLLVESDGQPVTLGTPCENQAGDVVGKVEDVIGPVDGPFLVVSLPGETDEGPARDELVGSELYPR